jgi:hypothetical protein
VFPGRATFSPLLPEFPPTDDPPALAAVLQFTLGPLDVLVVLGAAHVPEGVGGTGTPDVDPV